MKNRLFPYLLLLLCVVLSMFGAWMAATSTDGGDIALGITLIVLNYYSATSIAREMFGGHR